MALAEKILECLEKGIELNFGKTEFWNSFRCFLVIRVGEIKHWKSITMTKEIMKDEPYLMAMIDDAVLKLEKLKNS